MGSRGYGGQKKWGSKNPPFADPYSVFLKSLFISICKIVHVRNTHGAFSCGLHFCPDLNNVAHATWHRPFCHTQGQLQLLSALRAAFCQDSLFHATSVFTAANAFQEGITLSTASAPSSNLLHLLKGALPLTKARSDQRLFWHFFLPPFMMPFQDLRSFAKSPC